MQNRKFRLLYYALIYTLVFVVMCGLLQLYMSYRGKTLIEIYDGFEIRYPAAIYSRQSFLDFFTGKGIQQWDWTIGFGANPLMDLTGLAELSDPFYIFTLLFSEVTPAVYVLLTFLRLYAAGLAFLYYCKVRRFAFLPSLTAGMVYLFCTFTISFIVKHPVFALPLIALPIIWAGVEHALEGRPAYALTWGVLFSAASCLYFFYIIVFVTVLYTLARYIQIGRRPHWLGGLGKAIGRVLLYSILGVLMSAMLLIPQIAGILTSSRALVNNYSVSQSTATGLQLVKNKLIGLIYGGVSTIQFVPVAMIALLAAIIHRRNIKHHKDDLLLILSVVIIASSSWLQSALNGFSKPSYRWWVFGIAVISIACANLLTRRKTFKLSEVVLAGLGVVGCYLLGNRYGSPQYPKHATLILAAAMVAILLALAIWQKKSEGTDSKLLKRMPFITQSAIWAIMAVSVAFYSVYIYFPHGQHYTRDFVPIETANTAYKADSPKYTIFTDIDDDSFYRVDTQYAPTFDDTLDNVRDNSSLALDYRGVRTSKSIMDGGVYMFYQNNNIRNMVNGCEIGSLDERSALLSMAGVKYYAAAPEGSGIPIPYGYEQVDANEEGYTLWRNKYNLGIGYVADGYLLQEDVADLHPVEKQFAILTSPVLEKRPDNATQKIKQSYPIHVMDYSIENPQNLEMGSTSTQAAEKWASAELVFKPVQYRELYVYMPNLQYMPTDYEINPLVDIEAGGSHKGISYRHKYQTYHTDIQPDLAHMGYQYTPIDRIKISFDMVGEATYDSLQLISVDMQAYDEAMQRLQGRALQNTVVDDNSVSGTVQLEEDGVLFLSVPYSDGWHAKVNGRNVDILRANDGFCAIALSAGSNEVYMEYRSPYFRTSVIISLLGLAGVVALFVMQRRKKKHTVVLQADYTADGEKAVEEAEDE